MRMSENQTSSNVLLTEYEACMMDASQLDSDIWQSGSLIMALSIVSISLLLQTRSKTWVDFLTCVLAAVFGIVILAIWRRLFQGWLYLISVNFYRMREIEDQLGMWRERYIAYVEGTRGSRVSSEERARFAKLVRTVRPRVRLLGGAPGVERVLGWLLLSVVGGWVLLVVEQLGFVLLSQCRP